MDSKHRTRRDFWQNLAITFLSFTAVALLFYTQLDRPTALGTPASSAVSPTEEASALSAPVRLAVSGSYGRYGTITLSTADEAFTPLGSLLGEVLGAAQTMTACTRGELLNALDRPSIFFDFLSPLPLSLLGGFSGTQAEDSIFARYVILSAQKDGSTALYLWDGAQRCLNGVTALSSSVLDELIGTYEVGNASFARDEEASRFLHPLSLLLTQTPSLSALTASSAATDSNTILSSLAFNPHTQTRWTEEGGTEVIVDGDRTLRLRSGSVDYRSGGSTALQLKETDTLWDTVTETEALLRSLLHTDTQGRLYPTQISRSGASTTLVFDYHLGGVPIRSSAPAAEVTLSGNVIASLTLSPRCYRASEELALLLPLPQVLGIAARAQGQELIIGYADQGEEQVQPQWLCE